METIELYSRYSNVHSKLIKEDSGLYKLETNSRYIGIAGHPGDIKAIDLEGGPFLCVEELVKDFIIKDIVKKDGNWYFRLEKIQ